MVINLRPKHSAISSYSPITYLTHPSPKNTTSGNPVGEPISDKLTVRGWSGLACGRRVSFSSVVILEERRYFAIASLGESCLRDPSEANSGGSGDENGETGGAVDVDPE